MTVTPQDALRAAEDRAVFWARATFWVGGVLTVLAIVVGIWGVVDARENRQKLVEAIEGKNRAEQQASAAQAQSQREREEKERLQKVSINRLLDTYNAHLRAIQAAVVAYDAANRIPATAEGAAAKKAAAEQQLFAEVAAFTKFVGLWRDFAATLSKILDGDVDRMDQARARRSPQDIKDALDTLNKSFPDLRQILEVQLSQLAAG
jgi:lipopolysaccharide export LptBFGC system permease protein LptF